MSKDWAGTLFKDLDTGPETIAALTKRVREEIQWERGRPEQTPLRDDIIVTLNLLRSRLTAAEAALSAPPPEPASAPERLENFLTEEVIAWAVDEDDTRDAETMMHDAFVDWRNRPDKYGPTPEPASGGVHPADPAWVGDYLLKVDDLCAAAQAVVDVADEGDTPDFADIAKLEKALTRVKDADPDVSDEERRDWRTIQGHVSDGHTEHCAKRKVWGDGGCECGRESSAAAREPRTWTADFTSDDATDILSDQVTGALAALERLVETADAYNRTAQWTDLGFAVQAAREPECSRPYADSWCPKCGRCSCPRSPSGRHLYSVTGCPLHGLGAQHAIGQTEPPPARAAAQAEARTVDSLSEVGRRVHAWRTKNFGVQSRMRNALQIAEEVGEVARAVGKGNEGIRASTRGNLPDELGDVILSACAMAEAEGVDIAAIVGGRLARMESLDFTKDRESGGEPPTIPAQAQASDGVTE